SPATGLCTEPAAPGPPAWPARYAATHWSSACCGRRWTGTADAGAPGCRQGPADVASGDGVAAASARATAPARRHSPSRAVVVANDPGGLPRRHRGTSGRSTARVALLAEKKKATYLKEAVKQAKNRHGSRRFYPLHAAT